MLATFLDDDIFHFAIIIRYARVYIDEYSGTPLM